MTLKKFNFNVIKKEDHSRCGLIETHRGNIQTPAFMPVGTQATVKATFIDDIIKTGSEIILSNTYHLMLRPGVERIKSVGGLHKFMNCSLPILTDSGGFQVMSLSKFNKVHREEGAIFKSHIDGKKFILSPEKSIRIQKELNSDILMVMDECPKKTDDYEKIKKSSELSTYWASRSKIAFKPNVIQSSAINLCAALSGLEHGDARRAVDTLRVAGEIAERDNDNQVVDKHVRIALQKIEQDRLNNSIQSLPLHDKIVILSLYSSSTETLDSTGTIYKIYTQYCKKLSIDFLTQRSVSSIINELSLLGIISSTVISEGRYGRTKKIKKEIDYNIIKNIFSNDDTIQNLL